VDATLAKFENKQETGSRGDGDEDDQMDQVIDEDARTAKKLPTLTGESVDSRNAIDTMKKLLRKDVIENPAASASSVALPGAFVFKTQLAALLKAYGERVDYEKQVLAALQDDSPSEDPISIKALVLAYFQLIHFSALVDYVIESHASVIKFMGDAYFLETNTAWDRLKALSRYMNAIPEWKEIVKDSKKYTFASPSSPTPFWSENVAAISQRLLDLVECVIIEPTTAIDLYRNGTFLMKELSLFPSTPENQTKYETHTTKLRDKAAQDAIDTEENEKMQPLAIKFDGTDELRGWKTGGNNAVFNFDSFVKELVSQSPGLSGVFETELIPDIAREDPAARKALSAKEIFQYLKTVRKVFTPTIDRLLPKLAQQMVKMAWIVAFYQLASKFIAKVKRDVTGKIEREEEPMVINKEYPRVVTIFTKLDQELRENWESYTIVDTEPEEEVDGDGNVVEEDPEYNEEEDEDFIVGEEEEGEGAEEESDSSVIVDEEAMEKTAAKGDEEDKSAKRKLATERAKKRKELQWANGAAKEFPNLESFSGSIEQLVSLSDIDITERTPDWFLDAALAPFFDDPEAHKWFTDNITPLWHQAGFEVRPASDSWDVRKNISVGKKTVGVAYEYSEVVPETERRETDIKITHYRPRRLLARVERSKSEKARGFKDESAAEEGVSLGDRAFRASFLRLPPQAARFMFAKLDKLSPPLDRSVY